MWRPGCWDKGKGCLRAISMAKGCWDGEGESSEAQKLHGEVRRSTGRQSHVPAPRAAQGSPLRLAEYHSKEEST